MTRESAQKAVRSCLQAMLPDVDLGQVADDTPLLEQRIITSFQVLDLIIHLESASGRPVNRDQLKPGNFRDIATIAKIFLQDAES